MAEQSGQALEAELKAIWKQAANTRKRTAGWRIDNILSSSRAELSLRDLLIFGIYLGQAFFMLAGALVQGMVVSPSLKRCRGKQNDG
ncbi:MAG: hypothetical protein CR976_00035 [Thiotrichales bacterium]|nr:MAG: hypothetical protein CR976_00035 [Thiotrichales bacterium]